MKVQIKEYNVSTQHWAFIRYCNDKGLELYLWNTTKTLLTKFGLKEV